MFTSPSPGSMFIYVGLALLAISLVMLILFTAKRIHRILRRFQRKPMVRLGVIASIRRLFLILLLISVSMAVLLLGAFIKSYTAFTQRELAATVRCTTVPGTTDTMVLEFMIPQSPTIVQKRRYLLRGQQWTVEGHILKWDDWLNFLGLRTMYKLTRVRGRYLRAEDEMSKPATVYSLVSNENESPWRWLYEYGPRLPFVEAVYGNTVFTFPSETKTFDIYVTTTGLMVLEKEDQ